MAKIDAAREAYDALTSGQKDLVTNYTTLINAENTNAELVEDDALQFIADYMHMDDYTEDLGYCKDDTHHYYATANKALIA